MRDHVMGAAVAEFRRRRRTIGWWGYTIRIAIERDRGDRDQRLRRQTPFELGIARIAIREAIAMTIAVNHHIDIVGVIESPCGPLEGRIVEVPVRRPLPPQDLRDLAPVGCQARPTTFDLEVILIPVRDLVHWRRRNHRARDVLNQVAIYSYEPHAAIRPQRRADASGAAAPIISCKD